MKAGLEHYVHKCGTRELKSVLLPSWSQEKRAWGLIDFSAHDAQIN